MKNRLTSELIESVRRVYRTMPRSTVAGLARRFGIDHESTRKILTGDLRGGANLIADRIKNADEVQAKRGVVPQAEPAELRCSERRLEPKSRRVPEKWLAAREAMERRRLSGPSIIGSSARKGGRATAARRAK